MSSVDSLEPLVLSRIAEKCRGASSVLFITGAGLSAESGLPTYRGVGGLYNQGKTEEGLPIEEIVSGRTLQRDPALCWKYIRRMEKVCRGAAPSFAHRLIASFERRVPRVCVLTQNVDGLHARAGSTHVIEAHGGIGKLACMACSYRAQSDGYDGLPELPRCPRCGAVVRPEVVLFGEKLSDSVVASLDREIHQGFDVIFSIGTTSVFPYIRAPLLVGKRPGALTIEINPEETCVSSRVDHRLRSRAGVALQGIWERIAKTT